MIALYIAMLMQMPRPYWAMATVYIVSSPFVGPTSSKALSLTERGRELVQAVEVQLVRLRKDVLADIASSDLEAALRVLRAFEAASL